MSEQARRPIPRFPPVVGYRWSDGLLTLDDPDPVGHVRQGGASPVLLICDHAGNLLPRALGRLGVRDRDLARHIAYDIGALGVAERMSDVLDAELIFQRYSRLVIDCNRPPHNPTAFVAAVDGTSVPGNVSLSAADAARRVSEIFHPYQAAIDRAVRNREEAGRETVVVSIHSFTPQHGDFPAERPWHLGLLFNRDRRLADAVAAELGRNPEIAVGLNEPYRVDDFSDYAIPVHAEHRALRHVEFEIRQDLIATAKGQREWGDRLAAAVSAACGW